MKSIRVSLIVYFLSLLLVGLGGVSWLAYRTAADTLRTKEASGRMILEREFETREQDLRAELDHTILRKAKQVIAQQSKPPYRWLNVLPILATPGTSLGYLNIGADLRLAFLGAGGLDALAAALSRNPFARSVNYGRRRLERGRRRSSLGMLSTILPQWRHQGPNEQPGARTPFSRSTISRDGGIARGTLR